MFKIAIEQEKESNNFNISFIGKLPERYQEIFKDFFSSYSIIDIKEESLNSRTLKQKNERECRFCGKSSPTVTFKKRAHLVPELLGNKKIFSDFECDTCNAKFGKNENDFANFLGLTRSITGVKGKAGIPKFKTPDKTLVIREGFIDENDLEKKIVIESHGMENNHFILDPTGKRLVLNGIRHSYIPFNVYKAILKIALSTIDEVEVIKYKKAFDLLLDNSAEQNEALPLFNLPVFVSPGPPFPSPLILLFEKKDKSDPLPTHIAVMYFHNYIYQITLPFYADDEWMYDGKMLINFKSAPPFIDEKWANCFGYPTFQRLDFSKKHLIKGEKQTVTFSFNKAIMLPPENDNSQ